MSQERARHILKRAGYAAGGDVTPREPEPVTARPVEDVKPAKLQDLDVKVRQPDEVKPRELAPESTGGRVGLGRSGRRRQK